MNLKNVFVAIFTLVGVFLLGYFWPRNKEVLKAPTQYWESPNFKPHIDTSTKKYSLTSIAQNDLKVIEPWKITNYPKPSPTTSIRGNSINQDSIFQIVDSLNQVVVNLSKLFITSYPEASKLIGGIFTEDSLRLDLLQPNGNITSNVYLTYYKGFQYYYTSQKGMVVKSLDKPLIKTNSIKNTNQSLNANIGYLSVISSASLGLNYEFAYKKYNLQTSLDYFVAPNIPSIQMKVGYKLY